MLNLRQTNYKKYMGFHAYHIISLSLQYTFTTYNCYNLLKMKPIIIYLFLLLNPIFKSTAQSIVKCDDNSSFWLIEDNSINYSFKLYGDVAKSNMPDLINIEDRILQYIILDKIHFIEKKEESDENYILSNYVAGETKHLLDKFSKPFQVEMQLSTLPSGKPYLLWWYKLPEGSSEEVIAQAFINVIMGDIIFGLGSPQFLEDDIESTKHFLVETIATLSIVKNKNTLCN